MSDAANTGFTTFYVFRSTVGGQQSYLVSFTPAAGGNYFRYGLKGGTCGGTNTNAIRVTVGTRDEHAFLSEALGRIGLRVAGHASS